MGHDTRVGRDGLAAVEIAEAFRPDVVLLDLGMPKMDGYEACRRIRDQAWGKEMVLIAQTGWGQDEDRRRTQAAGFDHHLVKPIKQTELGKIARKADLRTKSGRKLKLSAARRPEFRIASLRSWLSRCWHRRADDRSKRFSLSQTE